ncbi:MAG: transposase [Anaerolineales bacterium]
MTSPPPLLYDAYYHIFNRGNNRENIFFRESNYEYFINLYFKYIDPIAETYAYCLLRNHFHVLLKTKAKEEIIKALDESQQPLDSKTLEVNYISRQFSNFFNAYAKAINNTFGRTGSLFQHPFGRKLITNDHQLWNVIAYIHQNPQKHRFVKDFRDWKWSSYGVILDDEPTKLGRAVVLDLFGGKESYVELNNQWVSDENDNWMIEGEYE